MTVFVGTPEEIAQMKAFYDLDLRLLVGTPVTLDAVLALGDLGEGFCRLDLQPRVSTERLYGVPVADGRGSALEVLRREKPEILLETPAALHELARFPGSCVVKLAAGAAAGAFPVCDYRGVPILGQKREAPYGQVTYGLSLTGLRFNFRRETEVGSWPGYYQVGKHVAASLHAPYFSDDYLVDVVTGYMPMRQCRFSGKRLREYMLGFQDDPARTLTPAWPEWPGSRTLTALHPRPYSWEAVL